jgi:radical SAM superfamily enzyme YgiQ (UPF0313 family)
MRVVLCAVNAKYIHSNLAVLYLHEAALAAGRDCMIREFSINDPPGYILSELYQHHPQVVGFSCYIWNIELVFRLCADLKRISPQCTVVLGGPEVSYSALETLADNPAVDFIVSGEGEEVWPQLLAALEAGDYPVLSGVYCRAGLGQEILTKPLTVGNMDDLPFPYRGVTKIENRIVYFESSRGCPYQCSYCISSLSSGVRYRSLHRVMPELEYLNALQPVEIKFVDRTFNCDQSRARTILEFIAQLPGRTRYHMEISPQLLNDTFLNFLESLPSNRFAFEIGVQSTHVPTLRAIRRSGEWDKISSSILRLRRAGNIHLHLDLIAGLPEEDYSAFRISFDETYRLKPQHLQLGFLKMLPGTSIRREAESGRYHFQHHPPYEVLCNRWLGYEELVRLHHIEDVLEKYYNAGLAENTLNDVISQHYSNEAFSFWEGLAAYWHEHGFYGVGVGIAERYGILKNYLDLHYPQKKARYQELLKYDVLKGAPAFKLPPGLESTPGCAELLARLLKQERFLKQYLPEFSRQLLREMKNKIIMERFDHLPANLRPVPGYTIFVYPSKGRPASRIIDIDAFWEHNI